MFMGSSFWTNTIWYILLGAATVVEVAFTLHYAKNRKQAAAFYVTLLGMALWLETVLLVFSRAYIYYPIIVIDPALKYDDVLVGNLFSQFSVAASMLLVSVLRLRFRWYVVLAMAYGAVEEMFLALGIYEHFWYSTWYTVALLPFAFLLARKMYDRLRAGLRPIFYYAYVGFSLFALVVITLWWGLALAELQTAGEALLADAQVSKYGATVSMHLVISTTLMIVYFTGLSWKWKALVMLALGGGYYWLYSIGWVIIRPGWFLPVSAAIILWTYLSIALMDRLYGLSGLPVRIHRAHKRTT